MSMINFARSLLAVFLVLRCVHGDGLIWHTLPEGYSVRRPDEILSLVRDKFHGVRPFPFSHVYSFGDSSCDTGNFARFKEYRLPNPEVYWRGHFSNGPMWPDYVQAINDVEFKNFCYAGAVINNENSVLQPGIPDFGQQVDLYRQDQFNTTRPLAILEFVGNDLLNETITSIQVAHDFEERTQRLIDLGEIKDIFVILSPVVERHRKFYNKLMKQSVKRIEERNVEKGVRVRHMVIMENVYLMLLVPPSNAIPTKWGASRPCYNETSGFLCRDPENYFLFDFYHFTTVPYYNLGIRISDLIYKYWNDPSIN